MLPKHVTLVEVGPRDGLQNEMRSLSVADKVRLIRRLTRAGLPVIEVGSFVSAKKVPQMADTDRIITLLNAQVPSNNPVRYPVLVPNQQGLEAALAVGAKEIAVFASASETFSQHNINCSITESLVRFLPVVVRAKEQNMRVRGYVSCVLGCPYEGKVSVRQVVSVAENLYKMGCDEISLGDTIGVGTPLLAQEMIRAVADKVPMARLAVHFHDTYGQALANIFAALQLGVSIIDCSVSGIGGCPYAHGATGNVATEDVLYLLNGLGITTGVDLLKVLAAGRLVNKLLVKPAHSKLAAVWQKTKKHQ